MERIPLHISFSGIKKLIGLNTSKCIKLFFTFRNLFARNHLKELLIFPGEESNIQGSLTPILTKIH
jgi:hypothetical protein